jgi:general secretion pathway protein A
MYEKFYGLRERPFDLGSDLRFLFSTETHREALSNLRYAIASRKGVTVLTGEVGTGKTMMIRAALAQADPSALCVHLTNPRLTRAEFFEFIAEGFSLDTQSGESKVRCVTALEERLIARHNRGEHSTLLIDEVQSVSPEVLEEIRLLTNIELASGAPLLSIILVGQPEFGERLNEYEFRHLKQRVALRCTLRPLTLQETADVISWRIRAAGGVASSLFTREAVQSIHEVAKGVLRVVSVLCDNALVTGFAVGERPVTSSIVADVCRDFHLQYGERADGPVVPAAPGPEGREMARISEDGGEVGAMLLQSAAPFAAPATARDDARPMVEAAPKWRGFRIFSGWRR